MRLNKYLADCGVGSRRACDKLIEEGKVKVNDKVATVTTQVEIGDKVSVNGKRVGTGKKLTYIMLHTTMILWSLFMIGEASDCGNFLFQNLSILI